MFLIKQWKDGGTIMHSTLDVPNFLQETMAAFGQGAQIEHKIVDIEGCYPSMPKDAMKVAMRDILNEVLQCQTECVKRHQTSNTLHKGTFISRGLRTPR